MWPTVEKKTKKKKRKKKSKHKEKAVGMEEDGDNEGHDRGQQPQEEQQREREDAQVDSGMSSEGGESKTSEAGQALRVKPEGELLVDKDGPDSSVAGEAVGERQVVNSVPPSAETRSRPSDSGAPETGAPTDEGDNSVSNGRLDSESPATLKHPPPSEPTNVEFKIPKTQVKPTPQVSESTLRSAQRLLRLPSGDYAVVLSREEVKKVWSRKSPLIFDEQKRQHDEFDLPCLPLPHVEFCFLKAAYATRKFCESSQESRVPS